MRRENTACLDVDAEIQGRAERVKGRRAALLAGLVGGESRLAARVEQTGVVEMDDARRLCSASTFNFFFGCRGVDVVVVGTTRRAKAREEVVSMETPVPYLLLCFALLCLAGLGEETNRSEERGKEGGRARGA